MTREYTYDTQFLLLKLDLETERLLAEVEPLILYYANIEAQLVEKG